MRELVAGGAGSLTSRTAGRPKRQGTRMAEPRRHRPRSQAATKTNHTKKKQSSYEASSHICITIHSHQGAALLHPLLF